MSSPLVQSWHAAAGSPPTVTSAGASITAGNLVVLTIRFSVNATGRTVTMDSVAGTEAVDGSGILETGGTAFEHVYYWANVAGGAGAITVTWTTGGGSAKWKASEYTGLATTSPLTQSGRGSGAAAASGTSPSVTTTVANSLVLGCFITSGVPTYTAGTGYTLDDANSLAGIQIEEQVLSSTTSLTAGMSWTGGSLTWASYILAFKYAASAAKTPISVIASRGAV